MSRLSLLLVVALLGVSFAAAEPGNIISCTTNTCGGQCDTLSLNNTLGTCQQVYGAGFGYGQVFCNRDLQKAYISFYGSDATCNVNNLKQIVVQKSGVCAQATTVQCNDAHLPLPQAQADRMYVVKTHCNDAACNGDSCADVNFIVDQCVPDYVNTANKFGRCEPNNAGGWQVRQQTWLKSVQGEIAFTCPATPAANITAARTVDNTCVAESNLPAHYGAYVRYGCGNSGVSAAAFTAPAFGMLVALAAAMLAMVRLQ